VVNLVDDASAYRGDWFVIGAETGKIFSKFIHNVDDVYPTTLAAIGATLNFVSDTGFASTGFTTDVNWKCVGSTVSCKSDPLNCAAKPSKDWMSTNTCGDTEITIVNTLGSATYPVGATGLPGGLPLIWVPNYKSVWCKAFIPYTGSVLYGSKFGDCYDSVSSNQVTIKTMTRGKVLGVYVGTSFTPVTDSGDYTIPKTIQVTAVPSNFITIVVQAAASTPTTVDFSNAFAADIHYTTFENTSAILSTSSSTWTCISFTSVCLECISDAFKRSAECGTGANSPALNDGSSAPWTTVNPGILTTTELIWGYPAVGAAMVACKAQIPPEERSDLPIYSCSNKRRVPIGKSYMSVMADNFLVGGWINGEPVTDMFTNYNNWRIPRDYPIDIVRGDYITLSLQNGMVLLFHANQKRVYIEVQIQLRWEQLYMCCDLMEPTWSLIQVLVGHVLVVIVNAH
jgi:hypothetical protein